MVIEILHKSSSLGRILKKNLQGAKTIYVSLSSKFQLLILYGGTLYKCKAFLPKSKPSACIFPSFTFNLLKRQSLD